MSSSEKGLKKAATSLLDTLAKFDGLIDYNRDDALIASMGAQEQLRKALTAFKSTDIERLREVLMQPAYKVTDEHGDGWWTMPEEVFDSIFAEFGWERD